MSDLRLEMEEGRTSFRPGESIRGTARWSLDEPPQPSEDGEAALEVRLFWYTVGKGERDVEIVDTIPLDVHSREGSHEFTLTAPPAPLSFSGKLISLIWALELVERESDVAGRQEIVLSHTGEEIRIGSSEEDEAGGEESEGS